MSIAYEFAYPPILNDMQTQTKGPRQPWHDLHCKIEGPAAYDVLENFEQRWRKATGFQVLGKHFEKATNLHDDALIKIDRISWILSPSHTEKYDDQKLWVSRPEDPENWHVQVDNDNKCPSFFSYMVVNHIHFIRFSVLLTLDLCEVFLNQFSRQSLWYVLF